MGWLRDAAQWFRRDVIPPPAPPQDHPAPKNGLDVLVDKAAAWIDGPRQEPEREAVQFVPQIGEVAEVTAWTEIEHDGEVFGEVAHVITRAPQGFYIEAFVADQQHLPPEERPAPQGPFANIEAAREAARSDTAEWQGTWQGRVDRGREYPGMSDTPVRLIGEPTVEAPTPTIDAIVERGLERLVQSVPQLPTARLLADAEAFRSEAATEAGWDNFSTAESMRGRADRYQLAAAMRDPEAPQAPKASAETGIIHRLEDRVELVVDDPDVGAHTEAWRSRMDAALGEIAPTEMELVIDELEATGQLESDAAGALKLEHRDRAAQLEREAQAEMADDGYEL